MTDTQKYYFLSVTSPELKTVGDFTHDFNSGAFQYVNKETAFLDIVDDNGVSNRLRLLKHYLPSDVIANHNKPDAELALKIGVRFAIPVEKVERNGLLTQGLQIVSNNEPAFKANALAQIEADSGYVAITRPIDGQIIKGTTTESTPEASVWIWVRSLSGKYDNGEMKGQIFDVTPFVQSLSTSMSKNGGSFSMTLPPLVCEQITDGTWEIKSGSMLQYGEESNFKSQSGQGYVAEGSLFDENMRRNNFLFHTIIGTNDLVFIRFEPLEMEKDRYNNSDGNPYIDKSQIPGKIYDMIGLVDINNSSLNPSSTDLTTTIAGRDLSKLFIEDGCYFYALEQASDGKMGLVGSASAKNGMMQRILSEGQLLFFNLWYNTSIEKAFAFVMNQLSNIKIVPDDLFSAYDKPNRKPRRNRTFKLQSGEAFKGKPKQDILKAYEDKAKAAIKQIRKLNSVANPSATTEENETIKLFNDLKKFFEDIRTKKVRVVDVNETAGWNTFTWINPNGTTESIGRNNFPTYFDEKLYKKSELLTGNNVPNAKTFKDIFSNIDNYIDVVNSTGKYKERYSEELASGIWQIIKLVIDRGVTERRIVDSSMSTAQGSIINFFKKICQSPFVEYFGDTYGDTYNMTVRKPITDQISLISMLEGRMQTEDGRVVYGASAVVNVAAHDVLKEDLYFDDKDVYSWYHLNPKFNTGGGDNSYQYFYLPAILFEEYAAIWGSRPMDLTSNYMPYQPIDPKVKETDIDISQKQAVHDLKYMIDSNMANPFMRKGTLILNGDRRLKVGNLFRYEETGEIFHIDSVQHNFRIGESMIDRTTTVQVSRGMVEQLIYGIPYWNSKNQEVDHISYFNIINTKLNFRYNPTPKTIERQVPNGFEIINNTPSFEFSFKYPQSSYVEIQQASFTLESVGVKTIVRNKGLDKLLKLQPAQQYIFIRFINAINNLTVNGASILVEITSTVRSKKEQEIEYSKNGLNAKPGKSSHEAENGGLAIDINLITRSKGKVFAEYVRKADSLATWIATGVPQLAKELGLKWGGDAFSNGYYDPVHFQIVPQAGSTRKQKYKTVIETKKTSTLDETAIFSNFKVNQHVFDFFLRGEHKGQKYNLSQVNRTIYKKDVKAALG